MYLLRTVLKGFRFFSLIDLGGTQPLKLESRLASLKMLMLLLTIICQKSVGRNEILHIVVMLVPLCLTLSNTLFLLLEKCCLLAILPLLQLE